MAEASFNLLNDSSDVLARKSSKELVLRAAVALVATSGVDNISISDIVRVSKVSRTTMYAHFGSVHDVLAEIWINAGAPWLRDRLASPPGENGVPSSLDVTLTEILAVAARIPEVAEVVIPDVRALWKEASKAGYSAETRSIWALAHNIGMHFTAPVVPSILETGWLGEFIASIPDDAHIQLELPTLKRSRSTNISPIEPFDLTDTADRLMKASVDVVAASGVHSASMTRIARVARLTAGSANSYFSGVSDVIQRGFVRMMDKVVSMNLSGMMGEPSNLLLTDQIAYVLFAAHSPERATWRRYRRELHLAARVDESLREVMRPTLRSANFEIAQFHLGRGFPEPVIQTVVDVNQALVEGFSILHDAGVDVSSIDHRIGTRWFIQTMFPS